MDWIDYTALCIASLFFLIGLFGSLLPIIPGSLIVWLGVLTHRLWMGADESVSWKIVILTGAITAIGLLADCILGIWGARKFGASWRGALGAVIGALVALLLPPPLFWLIVGPVVGAIVGELLAGRSFREGGKAGVGTILGGLVAFALKFGLSICVITIFFLDYVI